MKTVDKQILKFAIPNIISNITVPFMGLVDMSLMGHLESPVYIGGIALGNVIFNLIYWSLAFLRMSTSGLTAQAYGSNDITEQLRILLRALSIALLAGLLILLFHFPIQHYGFKLLSGTDEVKNAAQSYFSVRVLSAPASLAIFAFSGWFLGMHNARIPMMVAILVNSLNIILSILFVKTAGMNVNGVALGTALAEYSGLAIYVVVFAVKHRDLVPKINLTLLLPLKQFSGFLGVSRDIFLRTLCVILVFTWFTNQSAAQSNTVLAVNSLFREFLMFFSFLMDGFAYAAEPLIGGAIGSGRRNDIRNIVQRVFRWGVALTLFMTIIYGAFGIQLISLLTNQHEIIAASKPYLIYIAFIPLACFSSFLWDGIYIGATASRSMLHSILISTFLFFFPVWFMLNRFIGNHALWVAMLLFMLSRGIYLGLKSKRIIYQ